MTDIEALLWDPADRPAAAPCISRLSFAEGTLTLALVSVPTCRELTTLEFRGATITSMLFDEDDCVEWPLDIIGFDSYPEGEHWRFALNCSSIELRWNSAWPSKINTANATADDSLGR